MDNSEFVGLPWASPVLAVSIGQWSYPYERFSEIFDCAELDLFERQLEQGEAVADDDGGNVYSLCLRYVSGLIDNAGEAENADEIISKMLAVRSVYGDMLPTLARQIPEWICDFCLIGGHTDNLYDFYKNETSDCSFRSDFLACSYISAFLEKGRSEDASGALIPALSALCRYDFTASGYYCDNRELYTRVFLCAMPVFFEALLSDHGRELFCPAPKKDVRPAYRGLMCRQEASRVLEIEYMSFSGLDALCELVTSGVKYCDNLVRQGLSVKSKLMCIGLPIEYRRLISEAVRSGVPGLLAPLARVGRKPKVKKNDESPQRCTGEAEKPPVFDLNIDFTRAKRLEAESWAIAELLADDSVGDEVRIDFSQDKQAAVKTSAEGLEAQGSDLLCENGEWGEFLLSLSEGERKILVCVLCGGDAAALSRSLGGMPLGFADSINEKALDSCGDIIIEQTSDGKLSVFEDYRDTLSGIIDDIWGGLTSGRK